MSVELLWLRDFVHRRSAIQLGEEKTYLLRSRLTPLAEQNGLRSVEELARALQVAPGSALAHEVVEAMTTNETSFFRDGHPWVQLAQLFESWQDRSRVRIWCGAASSGQEVWSIAMVAKENLPTGVLELTATDLSTAMIRRCQEARYSNFEASRGLDAERRRRWFVEEERGVRVRDELRVGVRFAVRNLVGPWPRRGPWDLVMLRNVLFYFDVEARRRVLVNIRRDLASDGRLFLGASESTLHIDDHFQRECVGKSVCFRVQKP